MAISHKIAVALLLSIMTLGCSPLSVLAEESDTISTGWQTKNGKHYYFNEDGTKATGEQTIDGTTYLFGFSGALKTDWQTINGKRYYFDPVSGSPVFGWMDYFNERYYISETEGKLTGLQFIDGQWYQFEEDGTLIEGITHQNEPLKTEQEKMLFDENGQPVSGWYEVEEGKLYYADPETNLLVFGFVNIDGNLYHITEENGADHGAVMIDNKVYVFNPESGEAMDSWYSLNEKNYYFNHETLSYQTGLFSLDGNLYYLAEDDGHLVTGWADVNDSRYYFGADGVALIGLVHIGEQIYYFAEDGKMLTGFQTVDSVPRYFNENGAMVTGWLNLDGERYYFDETGSQLFGIQEIEGLTYYFDEKGILQENEPATPELPSLEIPEIPPLETAPALEEATPSNDDNSSETVSANSSVMLNVVDLKQFDPQWKNTALGNTTIQSAGCLLTCMSMLESYRENALITPPSMKKLMNFTSSGALASWNDISSMGYTVETYNQSINQEIMAHIYSALLNNRPVMFGSKNASGGQHYVVITGYAQAPTAEYNPAFFAINDAGSSWNHYLSEHLAKFPTVYKLVY